MQPRLKSSKKWTAFPKEYADQIQSVFKENFAKELAQSKLVVDGRIYPAEILLRVGFNDKGRLSQPNFEVSMNYTPSKKDAVERIHNCIDAAAAMMAEYFEKDGEIEFPLIWEEQPFQGQKVFLQYNTENSDLEAQANALLGDAGEEALVQGEDAADEAPIDLSAPMEEDEEESLDDADKAPKMFGGGKPKKKSGLH